MRDRDDYGKYRRDVTYDVWRSGGNPDRIDPDRVQGVFAIMGETVIQWGLIPPVVPARVDEQLISAGDRL